MQIVTCMYMYMQRVHKSYISDLSITYKKIAIPPPPPPKNELTSVALSLCNSKQLMDHLYSLDLTWIQVCMLIYLMQTLKNSLWHSAAGSVTSTISCIHNTVIFVHVEFFKQH